MMHPAVLVATIFALLGATLCSGVVAAGQDAPPDNLSVSGSVLSWRDNSADESGFQVSIMPVGGRGVPVFTHDVARNTTSFDLASDRRACSGPISVGVAALFADGSVLTAPLLVDANVASACAPSPATPNLPTTGTGVEHHTSTPITLAEILAVGAAAAGLAGVTVRGLARPSREL